MYDVAIIGAGPGGSTLARLIGKDLRVLLIDRRPLAGPADRRFPSKCCGGLLAPDAQEVIGRMGLGLPRSVLAGPQLFAVRTIDLEHGTERFYPRHYINVDREAFDRWLLSLVPGDVDVRVQCNMRSCERKDEAFEIALSQSGKEYREQARVVIGADGAFSGVRRTFFGHMPEPRRYVAIQDWFHVPEAQPYYGAFFDRNLTDFYCWSIPKDGCLIVGAALEPGPQAIARFEQLQAGLRALGFPLEKAERREGAYLLRPQRLSQVVTGRDGVALVGEAAGWISPSSAEGISYAFRSALALGRSLEPGLDGFEGRYRGLTRSLRTEIMLKWAKSPFMYVPWMRKAAMASGLLSLGSVAEANGKETTCRK